MSWYFIFLSHLFKVNCRTINVCRKKDTISAIIVDVVNIFEKFLHHCSSWKEYMLLDTHHCSGGKIKFSSFIRELGCIKVEKGIGKSSWNHFFHLILICYAQRQLEIIGRIFYLIFSISWSTLSQSRDPSVSSFSYLI